MKKQSIFSLVTLVAIFVLASCNKYEAKEVKLNTLNDSLNYTLGLANGDGIKNYYMQKDSSDKIIATLMKSIDKAFKEDVSKDEMYKLGQQIGSSFKQQKKSGLMGDSTLTFNYEMVRQGLVNALYGFKEGMSPTQADEFIRNTMMEIQNKKMMSQPAPSPLPEAVDTIN